MASEPRTARQGGGLIAMPDEPNKPRNPGLFPTGLVFCGPVVLLVVGFLVTKLFECIRWFVEWFAGGG